MFPIRTEQTSSTKRLLLYGSLQICEQQRVLVSASYKDERREQTIFVMSFSQTFLPKLYARKQEKGFDFIQNCLLLFFAKHDLV